MASSSNPAEVELLARFPRGFQQDMIADIEALPENERTFRMDNFVKNYQLQVKGWKRYRSNGGSLEQLMVDCLKGMYYAGSLGSNWAWDLRQHLLANGRLGEVRAAALEEMRRPQELQDMPLAVITRLALGCWFRHLQHQSSGEDVQLLDRIMSQTCTVPMEQCLRFLGSDFKTYTLPYEEYKFVVMRMRIDIKRQVARVAACKRSAMREVHAACEQLIAQFPEDALPHLMAGEAAKVAGLEYNVYGSHLQHSINAAQRVQDEVVGWQAAMLLQTCWFNGEAGTQLNIPHVRSLMHKLRGQNQILKKWGADRLLRGSQREQWHKMKESYDRLMEGRPAAQVIRDHLHMATPESMRPQAACDKCGCAMIRMKRCSGCQRVHYCSRECQRDDWEEHRLECTAMQEQLQEQQLAAALDRLMRNGPLPTADEQDTLAADLDAASVPAHRAPIAELPAPGTLEPEVQLVLDTMIRVAFPGHTEFATSAAARELGKAIMAQLRRRTEVQEGSDLSGNSSSSSGTDSLSVLAEVAADAADRDGDLHMAEAAPVHARRQGSSGVPASPMARGGGPSPADPIVGPPPGFPPAQPVGPGPLAPLPLPLPRGGLVFPPAAGNRQLQAMFPDRYGGPPRAGGAPSDQLHIPPWAVGIVTPDQMQLLQQVLQPIGAAANQRQAREITQQLHAMRRTRSELYYVSQLLGKVSSAA